MCRNIKTLFNFEPPVTENEVQAASLQFVRKITGFNKPSKPNEAAFQAASLGRALQLLRTRLGEDPAGWRWERLHQAVFPHDVFHEVPFLKRFFVAAKTWRGECSPLCTNEPSRGDRSRR